MNLHDDSTKIATALGLFAEVLADHGQRIDALERAARVERPTLKELRRRVRPEWGGKGGARLALEAGVDRSTVSGLESGAGGANPTRATLLKIARALSCSETDVEAAIVEGRRRRVKEEGRA